MHNNSLLLFKKYAETYFKPNIRVLEIGSTTHNSAYKKLVNDDSITWETLDIKSGPGITYVAKSEYEYNIPDNTFDIIIACQVLEHVRHPWRWFPELARLLKKEGHLISISPVSWPYHEAPVDCWRIYPEGLRALCEDANINPVICYNEALEAPNYFRHRPGRGEVNDKRSAFKYRVLKVLSYFGLPTEISWDAILIAKK